MKKRILMLLTAVAMTLTLFGAPAMAFTDVTNSAVQEAVEVLYGLGVVAGYSDGSYYPDELLTRAQFSKLAILVEGNGGLVQGSAYRTLFSDVSGAHWAAAYINRAYEEGLVSGYGNGRFGPDDSVTTGQAVTVALRLLGYTAEEIGPFWPEDDMAKATELGLLDGVTGGATQPITRGNAALLLYNLLQQTTNDGKEFLTKLCTTAVADAVLLDNDAEAVDGTLHTAQFYANYNLTYYVQTATVPDSLVGRCGTLLLNKSGQVTGFVPDETVCKTVSPEETTASGVTDEKGGSYAVTSATPVILDGEKKSWGDCWYDLQGRDSLTLYYATGGSIALVSATEAVAYDGVVLTGYYENASPNAKSPSTITMLGMTLEVSDSALKSLAQFSVGDRMTVVLDGKGEVAAAYATTEKKTELYGVLENTSGTIALTCGLTASGTLSGISAAQGDLVRVSASGVGKLSVTTVADTSSGGTLSLNVTAGTLGTVPVADDVKVYDRVGKSKVVQVDWDDIPVAAVSAAQVLFYATGADGRVSVILLSDATGYAYTYGALTAGTESGGSGTLTYTNNTVSVTNEAGTSEQYITAAAVENGAYSGVAVTAEGKTAGINTLTKVEGVSRAAFDGTDAVVVNGVRLPVSSQVQVYNRSTGKWMTLEAAKAYADTFTVYYDRTPETGGVVRVITLA